MQTIITLIVFLLILGTIIIIHEFGHFIAAKIFGVYCSHFSIGFGPKIWSKKGKETEYEIRALPFGGFVSMAGEEQSDDEELKDIPIERTLKGIKTYQKVIIFLAGVFMNFVLAIVVTFGVNVISGQLPVQNAQIGQVIENSPAQQAGLKAGDVLQELTVNETGEVILVSNFEDIQLTQKGLNTTADTIHVKLKVDRQGKTETLQATLKYDQSSQAYKLGIYQATRSMNVAEAIQYTFISIGEMSMAIFAALSQLITRFSETVTQLSGPVGIYSVVGEAASAGFINLVYLTAFISINVGFINFLPIPAFDGGRILFLIIEKIKGKPVDPKFENTIHSIGFFLLMALMILITYNDIIRLIG